jgi:hypothetical protein
MQVLYCLMRDWRSALQSAVAMPPSGPLAGYLLPPLRCPRAAARVRHALPALLVCPRSGAADCRGNLTRADDRCAAVKDISNNELRDDTTDALIKVVDELGKRAATVVDAVIGELAAGETHPPPARL